MFQYYYVLSAKSHKCLTFDKRGILYLYYYETMMAIQRVVCCMLYKNENTIHLLERVPLSAIDIENPIYKES